MCATTRLAIRAFAQGCRQFEEIVTVDDSQIDLVIPALAEKHAKALPEMHMIEIEFLDEPNFNERFFRFGTDPSQMVNPIEVTRRGQP
jgi:hypothetical protein